ncbi:MAG TPA: hypothetical protein VKA43_10735 [Gammaproteobacteria bacterium]|nr:hypothetical protein [Gammaproteobacteria bacterium]
MNDDFEQRLRMLLVADDDPPASERFDATVRTRIARLRRVRQFMLTAMALAATGVIAILVAPLFATGAAWVAETPAMVNSALGALVVSPAGYALGTLTVVAALVDTFRR